jgi:hypothetical protein
MRKILSNKESRRQVERAIDNGGGTVEFEGQTYNVKVGLPHDLSD